MSVTSVDTVQHLKVGEYKQRTSLFCHLHVFRPAEKAKLMV